jgi:hypothetical protein
LGGKDQEDHNSRPAHAEKWEVKIRRITIQDQTMLKMGETPSQQSSQV